MNDDHPVMSLPATTLRSALPRRQSAPLSPAIRRDMEGRFGADFGDVQVHTGPRATALCRALNARAFTLGRDIAFGAGRYAPDDPAGRRLLAHELVHVLQQRAAGSRVRPGLVAVGHAHDACEREADRLADEALGGGLRSVVTPDAAGVARRAPVLVHESGATLTADSTGASPGVSITTRDRTEMAVLHLTKNSGPVIEGRPIEYRADYLAIRAMSITGTVFVDALSRADIESQWEFHMIQVVYVVEDRASYAGRSATDGSMDLNFAPPSPRYLLDSTRHVLPYSESWPASVVPPAGLGRWQVTVVLHDHPHTDVPLRLPNFAANDATNHLYAANRTLAFITAFVVKDRLDQSIKILCHLNWHVRWQAQIRYRDGGRSNPEPNAMMVGRVFWVDDEATLGDPTGRGVAALIKGPGWSVDEIYSVARRQAFAEAIRSTTNSNSIAAEGRRSPYVPRDLFR